MVSPAEQVGLEGLMGVTAGLDFSSTAGSTEAGSALSTGEEGEEGVEGALQRRMFLSAFLETCFSGEWWVHYCGKGQGRQVASRGKGGETDSAQLRLINALKAKAAPERSPMNRAEPSKLVKR